MYFNDGMTKAELDAEYKRLSKRLHPDAGGTHEEFVQMSDEYRRALLRIEDDARKKNDNATLAQCAATLAELNKIFAVWFPEQSAKVRAVAQSPIAKAIGEISPEVKALLNLLSD